MCPTQEEANLAQLEASDDEFSEEEFPEEDGDKGEDEELYAAADLGGEDDDDEPRVAGDPEDEEGEYREDPCEEVEEEVKVSTENIGKRKSPVMADKDQERERRKISYLKVQQYYGGNFYSKPAALMMYKLIMEMNHESND